MRKFSFFALTSALALAVAGPALADPPRAIATGETVSASLSTTDAKQSDNSHYDDYTAALKAGQGVEIRMASSAFDAFLQFGKGLGEQFESVKTNDDGGGETNALIRFRADVAGAYTIRANALREGMTGAYTLAVREVTIAPPPTPKPLTIGQDVSGRIAADGARLEDQDRLYDVFTFSGEKGQRLALTVNSTDFDPMIELGQMKDGQFEVVGSADDIGPNDKNARLMAALPESGAYLARVISFDANGVGAYSVKSALLPAPPPAPAPRRLREGQVVTGKLGETSAMIDEFRPYDLFSVRGRKGEEVTVIMRSSSFDAFLDVGANSPIGFASVLSDDDGGGETNAKVTFTFTKTGTVTVRASALTAGAQGDYTISVE